MSLNFPTPDNVLLQGVAQYHARIVIPTLRAILPESCLGTVFPTLTAGSSVQTSDFSICERDFSADYIRVLIFMFSNNLTDLESFPLEVVWNYLRTRANPDWLIRICSKDNGPTGPELARRLFRCAILVGDAGAVEALLGLEAVRGIASDAVFDIKGRPYTTLELSLYFGTPGVTEVLLQSGIQFAAFKNEVSLNLGPSRDALRGLGQSVRIMVMLIRLDASFDPHAGLGFRNTWYSTLLGRLSSQGVLACIKAASGEQLRR